MDYQKTGESLCGGNVGKIQHHIVTMHEQLNKKLKKRLKKIFLAHYCQNQRR